MLSDPRRSNNRSRPRAWLIHPFSRSDTINCQALNLVRKGMETSANLNQCHDRDGLQHVEGLRNIAPCESRMNSRERATVLL
jgi:hypothetical protein